MTLLYDWLQVYICGCVLNFILPHHMKLLLFNFLGSFPISGQSILGSRDDHFQMRTSKYIPKLALIFYTTIIFYSLRKHVHTSIIVVRDFRGYCVARPTSTLVWPHSLNLLMWESLLVLMCCWAHQYTL